MREAKVSNKLQEAILSMFIHNFMPLDQLQDLTETFLELDSEHTGRISLQDLEMGFQRYYKD